MSLYFIKFKFYSIFVNKCCGSGNNSNDPYAKLCVPDAFKDMNIKAFNLMSRTNETSHISWPETCKYEYRLNASVCNDKQRWKNDKCRWQCKKLIEKGRSDDGLIWNPGICYCECDKSCDVGEYLDYAHYKYRKRLIDKLVEVCSEDISGNEMIYNVTLNDHEKVCNSCAICKVLLIINFIILLGIGSVYIYPFFCYTIKTCLNKLPYQFINVRVW